MAIQTGVLLQPVSAAGNPIVEQGIYAGPAGTRSMSMVTPDLGDRTSWYQKSVQVVDEVLVDSGDGLTFNSLHPWWVNVYGKLTYSHKQIPKRDGTFGKHADWAVIIKVNDVVVTSGFTPNYAEGKVTFSESQTGNTIKATYWHTDGVTHPSEWLLVPPTGKKFIVEHVELQVTTDIQISSTIRFEIWAGGTLATYNGFPDYLFEAGYGQMRADYRGVRDLVNAANKGQGVIPQLGEMGHEIVILPFEYIQAFTLDSAVGAMFRLWLVGDAPLSAELATGTFYTQLA